MPDVTLTTLNKLKQNGEKITCLTAYDATFAKLVNEAGVEVILVGDSLGMVLQGHDSTLPVSVEDMAYHTRAVKRGNSSAFIMADLPFMSYATVDQALRSGATLMQAGAHMVKLEGAGWLAETIRTLANNGVPVCAHMGLTPQAVNLLGGYKVQGRLDAQAQAMLDDAKALEAAGASMLLLECVPSSLANAITQAVSVPVIGIGAGSGTDGQVLVIHDMLGLTRGHRQPRFVKNFMLDQQDVPAALRAYVDAVKRVEFPAAENEF
ncbi:MAG: 3-methyl-2-oxobutanoate hydroxymethyltransferase [Pseudomonas sp.]|jgi:3-methyl-2-oxobutanoate hydroxymethyltransferase|uniref:3-methyl-2-oxobutanoate hydroxymethyltransferase n=1 Tax=Halopseudomonas TaxID=2901189 RepID=UPI001B7A38F0|nr:3-methyl-2-oxobutanoate hydroxymethyltransferase [Pseudomonas sp.]MBQ0777896.1 3-methyl-2-oxobutanoate hydroxymethyltransferase [Pseudomonas sp.]WOD10812.1 3-methyl-2-oxobutanoate hydroxymethyltransferase [Pseudomonas sp. NyZ704]|tara:strand:- start:681 stop:1475 length:795 start_codon:yes stop_codon:yes gene_type:complete